jgi:hypothetical protein
MDLAMARPDVRQCIMIRTILLCFAAGVWSGNGVPHFIRGITKNQYPTALGNGPVINFVVGWIAIVTTPVWLLWADVDHHRVAAWSAAATGLLVIGLFHAGPGAFGRPAGNPDTHDQAGR